MTATIEYAVGQRLHTNQLPELPIGAVVHFRDSTERYVKGDDGLFSSSLSGIRRNPLTDWSGVDEATWHIDELPGQRTFTVGETISSQQLLDLPLGARFHYANEPHGYVKIDDETAVSVESGHDYQLSAWQSMGSQWHVDALPDQWTVGQLLHTRQLPFLPMGAEFHQDGQDTTWLKWVDDTFRRKGDESSTAVDIGQWRGFNDVWFITSLPRAYSIGEIGLAVDDLIALPVGAEVRHAAEQTTWIKGADGMFTSSQLVRDPIADWFSLRDWRIISLPEPVAEERVEAASIERIMLPAESLQPSMVVAGSVTGWYLLLRRTSGTEFDTLFWRDDVTASREVREFTGSQPIVRCQVPPVVTGMLVTALADKHNDVARHQAVLVEERNEREQWKSRFETAANEFAERRELCDEYDEFMRQWGFSGRARDWSVVLRLDAYPSSVQEDAEGSVKGYDATVYSQGEDLEIRFTVSVSASDEDEARDAAMDLVCINDGDEFDFNGVAMRANSGLDVVSVESD